MLFIEISLISTNIISYYQFISQITGRFKELFIRNLIQAILQIISVVIFGSLWYLGIISKLEYKNYIIIWVLISLFLTFWYIFTYRKITFGKSNSFKVGSTNIKKFLIVDFPLMIVNLVASLMLSIDK